MKDKQHEFEMEIPEFMKSVVSLSSLILEQSQSVLIIELLHNKKEKRLLLQQLNISLIFLITELLVVRVLQGKECG